MIYLRLLMQSSQFMILASYSEVIDFRHASQDSKVSLTLACISLTTWVTLYVMSIAMWYQYRKGFDPEKDKKFDEYFSGIKNKASARIYSTMLLTRRLVLVVFLVSFQDLNVEVQLGMMLGLQMIYLSVIAFIRPFKLFKDNLMEVINEIFFTTLLIMLWINHTEEKWTDTSETAYLATIMVNSGVIMIIMFGMGISFNQFCSIVCC